ncbi:hypothetical protein C1645_816977 [Glomus cerebriforme]|uniref:WHIM1 domain-containing protein n=1 Tax=Glomus cerebriforme TaxID=658196 RepID=A0A397TK44_9GLOM|nr:hypothetical protein C1645_816977 [Glomus cerebriforme]
MGAAKVERSASPHACSISPTQAASTNPTVDSTTSYYSPVMDMDPKDMPETAFVIAFCVKFRSAINNISFWPEDLDEAICCKEGPNTLIESLHKAFIQNLETKKSRTSWVKRLSILINDWREKGHDFFADHNPIERANYDYYSMSNRDKVMIMQVLVSWQLAESAEIKRIRREHNEIVNDDDVKPLEVEVLGEDTSGSRYYYIGIGVRIYRESMISGRVKWETVSSTVDELKKFIFDYQGLDPNRSEQERVLYNKLVTTVLPYLEPLEAERRRIKEDVLNKVERDREIRLKKIEKEHYDSEILLVRTRSQAKRSVHREVKNTTGYLEIIKKPTDPTITTISYDKNPGVNTSGMEPLKIIDNANGTIKDPESPTTIPEAVESGNFVMNPITSGEDEELVATNKVVDPTSMQKAAEEDIFKDPLTKIDFGKTAENKEDGTVADTLDGVTDNSTNEDMLDRDDKCLSKNERSRRSKKVVASHRRNNSSSKMNLSSILTEEVSREAESVEQRSELSKMSISNILSSESSDVVHTDNKYFDEGVMDNGNNEQIGFVQCENESLVSYEFDTIVQKPAPKENEKVTPVSAVKEQNDEQSDDDTPNFSNDTIKSPRVPVVKKDQKGKTAEVNDDALSEPRIKRAFVPDAETMIKLEWSLNHPVFRMDEEIFGESTDTDLSECCSDCAMEMD